MTKKDNLLADLKNTLAKEYQIELSDLSYENIVNQFTQNYLTGTSKDSYSDAIFLENNEQHTTSTQFTELLEDENFKMQIEELIEFATYRYQQNYADHYQDTDLCLYKKYTYEDVCRLLNWDKNIVAQNIGGYKYDPHTNTFPVFINYHKEDNISDTIKYEDHFVDSKTLVAYSKSKRTLTSPEVPIISNEDKNNVQIHLFVRKNKDDKESKEFYYLGRIHSIKEPEQTVMPNSQHSIVRFTYGLENEVPQDIYDYITKI